MNKKVGYEDPLESFWHESDIIWKDDTRCWVKNDFSDFWVKMADWLYSEIPCSALIAWNWSKERKTIICEFHLWTRKETLNSNT